MRNRTALIKMISIPLALAALFACSNGNPTAPATIDAAGRHAVSPGYSNWVQQHWVEYKKLNGGSSEVSSATGCSECHGSDLAGGVSKVSCFGASFTLNGVSISCHANGDGTLGHPSSWSDPTSAGFHAAASFNGATVRGSANLAADCGLCHATAQDTALVGSAPSCLSTDPKWGIACHTSSPALNPQGCVSCHGAPPSGPTGNLRPNRQGKHAAHLILGIGCRACHSNGGSGTARHGVGNGVAYLNLSTGYRSQSGAFSYSAGKCSAVACHGGQQTLDWFGNQSMDVARDCTSCHTPASQALPQFNSFFSGKHQFHISDPNGPQLGCTSCHSPVLMTAHFTGLATPGFDGDPKTTLSGALNYSKNGAGIDSCTVSCHFDANGNNPDPNKVIFLWR
jgi:predicted CxxxxCH...CXXCH cytochrome family protein